MAYKQVEYETNGRIAIVRTIALSTEMPGPV
jgi:hypothetical protein